ncbi:glutathione transferase GST 23-like [Primulina huaijiensis]|uniref:glutathione transferase GST 23-like n=1 Tax=Primulina huaijiensis TaxID=1492673 RepID=UPI003CC76A12
MAEDLKLLRSWSSPYGMRVVHALKIKAIEHETVLEDTTNKSASLLEYNPVHKKIPVLVHNGKPICESLVILEYIDDTWKQRPLLPRDPWDRAMARFWANFGDEKVLPSIWSLFISQGEEQQKEAVASAVENLKLVEDQLKGKIFFGGDTIGYLDIAFGWMANLISILEEIAELTLIDAEIFPLLSAWMNNYADDPTIKESWPPRARMVEKFKILRQRYVSKAE